MRLFCLPILLLSGFSLLNAQSAFVTGSGYALPTAITVAPGQVATFYVGGLPQTSAGLQKVTAVLTVGGVPQALTVISAKATTESVAAVTVLIPFTVIPGGVSADGTPLTVSIQFAEADILAANGCATNLCSAPVSLNIVPTLPHVITTCDTFYASPTSPCQLAVTHQDGTLVTNTVPAKGGEILTIWALGLGVPASGIPATGNGPIPMNDITLNTGFSETTPGTVIIANPATPYSFAGLTSPATGLYQINFAVPQPPSDLQSCTQVSEWFTVTGNMSISVFRNVAFENLSTVISTSVSFFYFAGALGTTVNSICVSL